MSLSVVNITTLIWRSIINCKLFKLQCSILMFCILVVMVFLNAFFWRIALLEKLMCIFYVKYLLKILHQNVSFPPFCWVFVDSVILCWMLFTTSGVLTEGSPSRFTFLTDLVVHNFVTNLCMLLFSGILIFGNFRENSSNRHSL